jgi:D-alanyl-D-alanine-carboxypeptidase/D-alanyl-D-alanine-endopeptidase
MVLRDGEIGRNDSKAPLKSSWRPAMVICKMAGMVKALFPLLLLCDITPLHAEASLADATATQAGKLAAGCIVAAESIGGKRSYSIAGKGEPEEVPAEKLLFEIGSISKVFTGLLLADAVESGKLGLDTTLSDLLGKEQKFADPKVGKITLRQLATHTSGLSRLPDNIGPNPDAAEDPYGHYDREMAHAYLAKAKLAGDSPYPAAYSNYGMGLLGDLLAEAYGKTWEELVKEKITGPLGMKDTVVTLNGEQKARLAPPYADEKPGHSWTFQAMAGAGALRSTAADMLRFGEAMLDPAKTPLEAAIRRMMEPHAPYPDMSAEIGLGIIISKLDGEREYTHDGGTGGYRSTLQVIPALKRVRVVLLNNSALAAGAVLAVTRPGGKAGEAAEIQLDPEALDAFPGSYEIGPASRFTVVRREDALWVRLTGQTFLRVKPIAKDRFRYHEVDAELQFARENDKVSSVVLHQNGREITGKRNDAAAAAVLFPTEEELEAYAGEYSLSPLAIFRVSVKGGNLFAQLTGQPAAPVFATKPDYFEYDIVKAALEFERGDDGKIKGLVLHQNGIKQRAKRK